MILATNYAKSLVNVFSLQTSRVADHGTIVCSMNAGQRALLPPRVD